MHFERNDSYSFAGPSFIKKTGSAVAGLLLFSQTAVASSSWSVISVSVAPQNTPKVIAATDKLMSSAAGKEFPGRLILQVHVADGANPATHSFIPIYASAAAREAFVKKLQADPAWENFTEKMTKLTQPVSNTLNRTLKSWGEISDTDHLWATYAFDVDDPVAFVAALDKFMASATGKMFPGQVYVSEIVAGGITPVSHIISVGFASEAEMEAWNDSLDTNADWKAYLRASDKSAKYLGSDLVRDLKTWGAASLKDLTTR